MKATRRDIYGRIFASAGALIVLAEITLHFIAAYTGRESYELNHAVLLTGAVVGFIGFWMIGPKDAESAAGFIMDKGITFVKAVRGGRRSTDTPVITIPPVSSPTDRSPQ